MGSHNFIFLYISTARNIVRSVGVKPNIFCLDWGRYLGYPDCTCEGRPDRRLTTKLSDMDTTWNYVSKKEKIARVVI